MTLNFPLEEAHISLFVKCLDSLPNLHTLELAWSYFLLSRKLKKALRHLELPQIKTLILPVDAHPLLEHCPEVEDVVCAAMFDSRGALEVFLRSLASNRDSKVHSLAIPLTSQAWDMLSRE